MMEQAFGYRGGLRFVEFSYSPLTHQFRYSDGGDHVPSDAHLWPEFVNHPVLCGQIGVDECPTLYGNFQHKGWRFCRELNRQNQEWHCLLIDRQQRRSYLCTRKQVVLFFPLTEPADGDHHTVFWHGMVVSPNHTEFKALPRVEVLQELYACLDDEVHNTFL